MSEKGRILGDKAPENPWEEMVMLRQEIRRLRIVVEKIVMSQRELINPGERFVAQDEMNRMRAVLRETGYEPN